MGRGHYRPTICDADHPLWVGATDHTAEPSESSALTWALLWAFSCPAEHRPTVRFWYDCDRAGKAAGGLQPVQPHQTQLTFLRSLAQTYCAARGIMSLPALRVPAHTGHPINELADALAKAAARRQLLQMLNPPRA